jgi:hypothetical protein
MDWSHVIEDMALRIEGRAARDMTVQGRRLRRSLKSDRSCDGELDLAHVYQLPTRERTWEKVCSKNQIAMQISLCQPLNAAPSVAAAALMIDRRGRKRVLGPVPFGRSVPSSLSVCGRDHRFEKTRVMSVAKQRLKTHPAGRSTCRAVSITRIDLRGRRDHRLIPGPVTLTSSLDAGLAKRREPLSRASEGVLQRRLQILLEVLGRGSVGWSVRQYVTHGVSRHCHRWAVQGNH